MVLTLQTWQLGGRGGVGGDEGDDSLQDFEPCSLPSSQLVTMAENFLTKSKDAVVAALAQATDSLALGADSPTRESILPFLDSFDRAAKDCSCCLCSNRRKLTCSITHSRFVLRR